MAGSPSMRRRRLAAELRRLRTDVRLTVDDVAGRLQWPASKVSRIENRQVGVSTRDLRKMLDLYQVQDQAYRAQLLEMGRRATERGWWQSYSGLLPALGNLIGLEAEAATIRTYEPELIPGLLQTADYARAVIRAWYPGDTMEQIDRRVEVRLERQEALMRTDPSPPKVSVVLNEGALARRVGSPEIMRAQLEHLMRERDRANVVIQVLPFSTGEHPAMVGPFTMLTFLDPADPGVVNVENVLGALAMEQPEEIRAYEEVWGALQARAVSPDDSRAIIKTYALR
ncbi:MAG: helix-turn-helix domain-containing protein [Nocardiopsaceae bacterium]|nr:helix-turn-helix domain-containing protein [Nocardiopsaceae bacterium]